MSELQEERDRLMAELASIGEKFATAKPKEISGLVEREGVIKQTLTMLSQRITNEQVAALDVEIAAADKAWRIVSDARGVASMALLAADEALDNLGRFNARFAPDDEVAKMESAIVAQFRARVALARAEYANDLAFDALNQLRERRAILIREARQVPAMDAAFQA